MGLLHQLQLELMKVCFPVHHYLHVTPKLKFGVSFSELSEEAILAYLSACSVLNLAILRAKSDVACLVRPLAVRQLPRICSDKQTTLRITPSPPINSAIAPNASQFTIFLTLFALCQFRNITFVYGACALRLFGVSFFFAQTLKLLIIIYSLCFGMHM